MTGRASASALLAALALACVSASAQPTRRSADSASTGPATWSIKTRAHVDLWLHAFATLTEDTAQVPLFRRGWRDAMTVEKNTRALVTPLDRHRDSLAAHLRANPALAGAQFLALSFGSWEDMRRAFDAFSRAQGDPRRSSSREMAEVVAFLASVFPTGPDQAFARLLMATLDEEQARFFHPWSTADARQRAAALSAVDSLWRTAWQPALRPFLDRTQQAGGDLLLSPVLGGEGRTVMVSKRRNVMAITFPATPDSAVLALFAFVHEAVGAVATTAVHDHVTPAQQRAGLADRYQATALVRGGAMLLERVAPDLVPAYARWYLALAGVHAAGNALDDLARIFPLPDEIIASLRRQVEVAFGGI